MPAGFAHAGLAIAAVRAGAIGILDGEFTSAEMHNRAAANARSLTGEAAHRGGRVLCGLRLTPAQLCSWQSILDVFSVLPHQLVLGGWEEEELPGLLAKYGAPGREIWLEVGSGKEIRAATGLDGFHGWVARGEECGGRCGLESAFMLCQRLAGQSRPFFVQGGIGPYAAAACRAAGAAGVVVDDILLLLRESPLGLRERAWLEKPAPQDTMVIEGLRHSAFRVANHAEFPAARLLQRLAEEMLAQPQAADASATWDRAVSELCGWSSSRNQVWPLGETAGMAAPAAREFGSTGRLVRAIIERSQYCVAAAARLKLMAANSPLAESHQTHFPIVQGPMARVSDNAGFAAAVAAAGALPVVALALLNGRETERLLTETQQLLCDRSWGVGTLGFAPADVRQEQLKIIKRIKPRFALIAGGRPDQASELEALGIATYLHAPTPETLRLYFLRGVRRFVLEGGECGGHVGPLHSFALWEDSVRFLVQEVPSAESSQVHILFAGGIHDARSAAMVAALAAPLAERGMKVGVLLGTAYMFTHEIVETGSVLSRFQQEALACDETVLIETKPGHRMRCAPSAFLDRFQERRAEWSRTEASMQETGDKLEQFVTGRLRLAAKGLVREAGQLVAASGERQRAEGMYMIGEAAALKSSLQSCEQLHADIANAAQLLNEIVPAQMSLEPTACPTQIPIAIVGIGCLLPGAHDAETLWRNLLDGPELRREIPAARWDWSLYYDPDPAAQDRIYSKWGYFLDPVKFDPLHFGIPPNSLASISVPQLIALEVTRRALQDAGFGDHIPDPAVRSRTAVYFGACNTADMEQLYKARSALPLCVGGADAAALRRLPEWTEESYPGILVNIVAGRVANRFDLGGANFTVDAACASSLAALDLAARDLDSGRADLVLAGGIELDQTPQAYMAFSKTRALSPRGISSVFDETADGIVLSEGAVVLVMKRLADAERDGDRVYAVLRGVAGASDGKGMSLTAPKSAGQARALVQAYARAGLSPSAISYYEAHGTGTAVGDRTELETIDSVLRSAQAGEKSCAVGGVKNLLGHTRAAAGMVGVVKMALALYHRTLPPQAGVSRPLAPLLDPHTPLYLLDAARPWLARDAAPRCAGVSAFGFGGTNFHAVLEEYRGALAGSAVSGWPLELVVTAANTVTDLHASLIRLAAMAADAHSLASFARQTVISEARDGPCRVAILAKDLADFLGKVRRVADRLEEGSDPSAGLFVSLTASAKEPSDLAFLFPGQGSQYPGMGGLLACYFEEVRRCLEMSQLGGLILPPAALSEMERDRQVLALADTRVAQPALAALSCGMLDLAERCGLTAGHAAGHSFGEFLALHAAKALDRESLMRLARKRGQIMAELGPNCGTMAAVSASADEVRRCLGATVTVSFANFNSPRQVVLSGSPEDIEAALLHLDNAGLRGQRLAVSAAFHSPLVQGARGPFETFLQREVRFSAPAIPVYSNLDGSLFPGDPDSIRARCGGHMVQSVNFVALVERMYDAGARTFFELGPKQVITGLTDEILTGRPHLAIAVGEGLRGWLSALARLFVAGHPVRIEALFDERPATAYNLEAVIQPNQSAGYYMDGGRVWRSDDAEHNIGQLPFLNHQTSTALTTFGSPVVAGGISTSSSDTYREYQETMRRFLEQQERVLNFALGNTSSTLDMPLPPAPAVVPVPESISMPAASLPKLEAKAAPPDQQQLITTLLTLVSERTGYALHTLDPSCDMEAELGIDSIKRIEILSRLENTLPSTWAERVRRKMERLTRAKSISAMAAALLQEAEPIELVRSIAEPAPGRAEEECPRSMMSGTERPLPNVVAAPLSGLFLVTEDSLAIAERTVAGLREFGADAALLKRGDLATPALIAKRADILRQSFGPVRGIIHLAPLDGMAEPGTLAEWRQAAALANKALFHLLQSCVSELNDDAMFRLVAASQLGGDFGRGRVLTGSAAAGGCHGIIQSVMKEYPKVLGKAVDFDASFSLEDIAQRIVAEVLFPGGGDETGYPRGRRTIYSAQPAPLLPAGRTNVWKPAEGWVVLVTGGARGITAEICRELAQPGVRLVVVGRTQTDASASRHLQAFRNSGAEVEFISADVRCEDAFGALLNDIYRRYGRLDAVLHGAGVIEDAGLPNKDPEAFARVFDTKADSAFLLHKYLRPSGLKWVVMFGSISGRFGNHGQIDYAAANETMTRMACRLSADFPDTRVLVIHWGPWKDTGMAAGAGLHRFLEQGIRPIETAAGRRFFVQELARGNREDVEVIAGHGPWVVDKDPFLSSVLEQTTFLTNVGTSLTEFMDG